MSKANTFAMNHLFNAIDAWLESIIKQVMGK